jgi:hypothetical protein
MYGLECRGIEPTAWILSPGWECKVEGGKALFKDLDFSQGEDWCDYDENTKLSLMISETETRVSK